MSHSLIELLRQYWIDSIALTIGGYVSCTAGWLSKLFASWPGNKHKQTNGWKQRVRVPQFPSGGYHIPSGLSSQGSTASSDSTTHVPITPETWKVTCLYHMKALEWLAGFCGSSSQTQYFYVLRCHRFFLYHKEPLGWVYSMGLLSFFLIQPEQLGLREMIHG